MIEMSDLLLDRVQRARNDAEREASRGRAIPQASRAVCDRSLTLLFLGCLLLILGFVRPPMQDEFLCQVSGSALTGVHNEICEEQPEAAIRFRIVGIRDGSRGQIAAYS